MPTTGTSSKRKLRKRPPQRTCFSLQNRRGLVLLEGAELDLRLNNTYKQQAHSAIQEARRAPSVRKSVLEPSEVVERIEADLRRGLPDKHE